MNIYIYIFFCLSIDIINLSLDELKLVAKISIPKKKLKEIKKDFSELRYKFSKKEIDKFRKSFDNIKHKNLCASEIREAKKNLVEKIL